jgi:hypothetical protein
MDYNVRKGGQGMATTFYQNNSASPVSGQASSTPTAMRDSFSAWLSDSKAKKFSPQVSIACLDRISEYVTSKKISCSIWEISKSNVYKPVYQKVMDTKLLRIMKKNTYKVFTVIGQLYLKYLKEKSWEQTLLTPIKAEEKESRPVVVKQSEVESSIEATATSVLTIKEAVTRVMEET